jgi:hypothetical protein
MPIYPTVKEASENLFRRPQPMDPLASLKANAFRPGPQWGGDQHGMGGDLGDLSEAQMIRDMEARDLISARHRQANEGIAFDEAQRGDPMERQIEGLQKNAAYESLLPSSSRSHVRFGLAGGPLIEREQERGINAIPPLQGAPSGLTRGQEAQLQVQREQARAKQNPADQGRADIAGELAQLESALGAAVEAGTIDPVEAQKRIQIARTRAKQYADLLKSGYAPFEADTDSDLNILNPAAPSLKR